MYNINDIKIELIDESAVRLVDVPDEVYFGEEYKNFISNSSMALINPAQGGSPTKFLTGFKGSKASGGALELGTAVHRMILEKDKYFIDDVVKPTAKVALVMEKLFELIKTGMDPNHAIIEACQLADYYASNLTQTRIDNVLRDGKDYLMHLYDQLKCEGCITLTQEHKDKLDKCLASVKGNKHIMTALEGPADKTGFHSFNEDVIIMKAKATLPPSDPNDFEDKAIELSIKVKIDNWSIDTVNKVVTLNDIKTTGSSIADFIGNEYEVMNLNGEIYKNKSYGSFEKFHYYRQMALYMRVLKAYVHKEFGATEEDGWTFQCNMLVVETNEPHYSHMFEVGDRWLGLGTFEYESLLKRIAYHNEYGYDSFTNITINGVTTIW